MINTDYVQLRALEELYKSQPLPERPKTDKEIAQEVFKHIIIKDNK